MKTGLFIGRFQPFHKGHLDVIKHALKQVDRIIIVIGSAQYSHSADNPFSSGERIEMIDQALSAEGISKDKYLIVPVTDVNCYPIWVAHLKTFLPKFDFVFTGNPIVRTLFEKEGYNVVTLPIGKKISATKVRSLIKDEKRWGYLVPEKVETYIIQINGDQRIKDINQGEKR